jgi:hypothetical protein
MNAVDEDVVWVRATTSFGDVAVGDVFSLPPERARALELYLEPVNLETLDVTQEDAGAAVPMALGEPELAPAEEDEVSDEQGGRLPAED